MCLKIIITFEFECTTILKVYSLLKLNIFIIFKFGCIKICLCLKHKNKCILSC